MSKTLSTGHKRPNDADFTPPRVPLGPHVAALGMRFYTGDMFPPEYKNQIFIAEHWVVESHQTVRLPSHVREISGRETAGL